MKINRILSSAVALAVSATLPVHAATLYFDFGDTNQQTSLNYNNIYVPNPSVTPTIANAVDSTGASTGVGLTVSGLNPGSNLNGTTAATGAAAFLDAQATKDNMFGHSLSAFNQPAPLPLGVLAFSGLDGSGNTSYAFTFFASRTGVSDNRETKYEVLGANSGTVYLDAANNVGNIALLSGIIPNPSGSLTVNISPGPNNNNTSGFFYIGALRLETSAVPEPSSMAMIVMGGLGLALARRQSRRP